MRVFLIFVVIKYVRVSTRARLKEDDIRRGYQLMWELDAVSADEIHLSRAVGSVGRGLPVRHEHASRNMQAVARQCRALYLCEQAATASKHWAVYKEYRDPNVSTIVSIAPVRKPEDVHAPTVFEVFFKNGENVIPAEKVFDDALEFWRHFIYQNQIAANDPLPGQ